MNTTRWLVLAWLTVWVPVYARFYGAWHFLMLCNLGVLLTAVGLWFDRPLLLSAQAVAAPGVFVAWVADAGMRMTTGHFLHGGTAYMWDASTPWYVRALSLYHLAWPFVLAMAVARRGYDRRGFALQVAIVAATLVVGILLAPQAENLQFVWHAPGVSIATDAPWTRAAGLLAALAGAVYLPTHLALCAVFARRRAHA